MSKKQWFVLLCLFIVYLLLGAIVFHEIEKVEEKKRLKDERLEREQIQGTDSRFSFSSIILIK